MQWLAGNGKTAIFAARGREGIKCRVGVEAVIQVKAGGVPLSRRYRLSRLAAMSSGAPLVFSDTGPCREAAGGEEVALMVDFHSPEAIAGAVNRLLADRALAARLGKAARERILRVYDMETVSIPQMAGIIDTLARGELPEPLR